MSEKTYGLSKKALTEEYEDLVFRKVMALHAEKESQKILEEIAAESSEGEKKAKRRDIERLFSRWERRENLGTLWKYGKKLITAAAMVALVGVISVSSVVYASAEAREAIAEYLYSLTYKDFGRYTEITNQWYADPRSQRYVITYIPRGFDFMGYSSIGGEGRSENYVKNDRYIYFREDYSDEREKPNPEDFAEYEERAFGDTPGAVAKTAESVEIYLFKDDAILLVEGNKKDEMILIRVAESIVPNEAFVGDDEPAETAAEIIDAEIYTWENAYGLTYIPENFVFYNADIRSEQTIIDYIYGNQIISFFQAEDASGDANTENAEVVETIQIGESEALLVVRGETASVNWFYKDMYFLIIGNAPADEIVKMAKGVVPVPEKEPEIIDAEIYDWDGAWAPTYMAAGYVFSELKEKSIAIYESGEKYVAFSQSSDSVFQVDTEDTDKTEMISINGSEAIYVEKNGFVFIVWSISDKNFSVRGTIEPEEAVKIAEGLIPVE